MGATVSFVEGGIGGGRGRIKGGGVEGGRGEGEWVEKQCYDFFYSISTTQTILILKEH